MTFPRRYQSRAGFTLVELLVAITVLAILAGFLAPAVIAALTRAKEATVVFEMKQLELAIEQFKNDYGFYPPTIDSDPTQGAAIQNVTQMRAYLNKISPQNAESSSKFTGSTNFRIDDWWTNVGSQLNERSSLQFWLSGLCKNKQFPLTGGVDVVGIDEATGSAGTVKTICGYGADRYSDGSRFPRLGENGMLDDLVVERNNFYEFKKPQLRVEGGVAYYEQTIGDRDSGADYPRDFRYRDYKSYPFKAYHDGQATVTYLSPNKFQLVTFGKDGLPGGGSDANGIDITNGDAASSDNLANFTEGRLELYGN